MSAQTKWPERETELDPDANGGQIKFHIMKARHLPSDTADTPTLKVPKMRQKELSTIEELQHNARVNALNSILNQDKCFSEFKDASHNLLRKNSEKSIGDTDLTSLSSKIVSQHRRSEQNLRK